MDGAHAAPSVIVFCPASHEERKKWTEVGKVDFIKTRFEVFLVHETDISKVQLQLWCERFGQDSETIVFTFSITHDDLLVAKLNVFTRKRRQSMRHKPHRPRSWS